MSYWRRRYTNPPDPDGCLRWVLVAAVVAVFLLALAAGGLIRF